MAEVETDQHVRRRITSEIRTSAEEGYEKNGPVPSERPDQEQDKPPQKAFSMENICWLVAASAVFYFTEFHATVLYDPRVKRTWLNIGCVLITFTIVIALYLIVYLSYIRKISSDDWEKHYPAAIPLATASFAFGSFCVTVGLWPVWSLLTPVILLTLFMGCVVIIAMLPPF